MTTARPASPPKSVYMIGPRLKYALCAAASLVALSAAVDHVTAVDAIAQAARTMFVRSVDEPALQPFEAKASMFTASGVSEHVPLLSVPAGKRLVIEYINAGATSSDPTADVVGIVIRDPNTNQTYSFPGGRVFNIQGTGFLAMSFPTRIYVNPGSALDVSVSLTNGAGGDAQVTASGYLVDLQ